MESPVLRNGELVTAIACSDGPLAEGVEEFHEIETRLRAGFRRVCEEHTDETVLVVGHGGTLKALVADIIGLPPRNIHHLSLRGNTSLTEIDFRHAPLSEFVATRPWRSCGRPSTLSN